MDETTCRSGTAPISTSLYGDEPEEPRPGVHLRSVASHAMLRLRWNAFYTYLQARTLRFLGLLRRPKE